MQRTLVMTLIGTDRPGLVDAVASLVAEHEGNWLESRLSRLGGQFAGIVQIIVPAEHENALVRALKNLDAQGLKIVVHSEPPKAGTTQPSSRLEIVGQDRPGIVRQISHALASFGVNVEELQTECVSAAMSGEALFKARAKLTIPQECSATDLRQTLEKIAADLIVDITLEELPVK